MKHLLYIVFVCLFAACTSGVKQQENTENQNIATDTGSYYKRYEGTVAGQPVVLHLIKNSRLLTANYNYTKQGKPIELYFSADSGVVNGYTADEPPAQWDAQEQPQWKVVIDTKGMTGKWISADKQKTYDIKLQEAYPAGSYQLGVWERSDSIRLKENRESPQAQLLYTILQAGKSMQLDEAQLLETIILRELGADSLKSSTIEDCIDKQIKNYATWYRDIMKDEPDSMLNEAWMNYYSAVEMDVVYNDNGWLSLTLSGSEYTGGAHGNYAVSYVNIDMQNKKKWTMEDILTVDTLQLQTLLEAEARKQYNMSPTANLEENYLTDKILPNGNIYITHRGITFVYNPYEIASYAQGTISLFIPYDKLKPLLKPAFKQRMGIN